MQEKSLGPNLFRRVMADALIFAGMIGISPLLVASLTAEPAAAQGGATNPPPAWNEIPLGAGTYRQYQNNHQTDTIDIPVKPNGGEIEYMLKMKQGESVVYSWRAVDMANPEKLTSEFHGHTERAGTAPGTLIFYRKAMDGSESGSLVAPFEGIHGWYLKNDTERPIVVRLTVAGFYELIPNQIR